MRGKRLRLPYVLMVALTVLVSTTIVRPTWARSCGLDVWNYATYQNDIQDNEEFSRELSALANDLEHRVKIKESLIRDLVENRTQFQSVALEFQSLNQGLVSRIADLHESAPNLSDEQLAALNVLDYLRIHLANSMHLTSSQVLLQHFISEYQRLYPDASVPHSLRSPLSRHS